MFFCAASELATKSLIAEAFDEYLPVKKLQKSLLGISLCYNHKLIIIFKCLDSSHFIFFAQKSIY